MAFSLRFMSATGDAPLAAVPSSREQNQRGRPTTLNKGPLLVRKDLSSMLRASSVKRSKVLAGDLLAVDVDALHHADQATSGRNLHYMCIVLLVDDASTHDWRACEGNHLRIVIDKLPGNIQSFSVTRSSAKLMGFDLLAQGYDRREPGPAPGDKHDGPFGSEPKAYGKLPPGANWEAWKRSAHPGIRHYLVRVG